MTRLAAMQRGNEKLFLIKPEIHVHRERLLVLRLEISRWRRKGFWYRSESASPTSNFIYRLLDTPKSLRARIHCEESYYACIRKFNCNEQWRTKQFISVKESGRDSNETHSYFRRRERASVLILIAVAQCGESKPEPFSLVITDCNKKLIKKNSTLKRALRTQQLGIKHLQVPCVILNLVPQNSCPWFLGAFFADSSACFQQFVCKPLISSFSPSKWSRDTTNDFGASTA